MAAGVPVALALGANLGDRAAALADAVARLGAAPGMRVTAVSPVFETEPVGGPDQPQYLNAVVVGETTLDPLQVLALAHEVEAAHHRTREVRWGPRTLDVDVLAMGRLVRTDPALTLPHPRAHERGFVLVPWACVDPAFDLPGHGRVDRLAAAVGDAGLQRRDDIRLLPSGDLG